MVSDQAAIARAVGRILAPLARILLRHGVPHATFSEWAKQALVDGAEAEGGVAGRKVSTSRISVVTGLTRKDVARIRAPDRADADTEDAARYHRAARVVTGWNRDPRYAEDGGPRALAIDGESPSFASLVRDFAGDVPPRAVLDELERVGAVERAPDDRLRVAVRAWIPRDGEAQKLEVLGQDAGGLLDTIAHNLESRPEDARFQREVFYDNLPDEAMPEIRAAVARHGQALLEELDRLLASFDRDASPDVNGTGRRAAGVGVFLFEDAGVESRVRPEIDTHEDE